MHVHDHPLNGFFILLAFANFAYPFLIPLFQSLVIPFTPSRVLNHMTITTCAWLVQAVLAPLVTTLILLVLAIGVQVLFGALRLKVFDNSIQFHLTLVSLMNLGIGLFLNHQIFKRVAKKYALKKKLGDA